MEQPLGSASTILYHSFGGNLFTTLLGGTCSVPYFITLLGGTCSVPHFTTLLENLFSTTLYYSFGEPVQYHTLLLFWRTCSVPHFTTLLENLFSTILYYSVGGNLFSTILYYSFGEPVQYHTLLLCWGEPVQYHTVLLFWRTCSVPYFTTLLGGTCSVPYFTTLLENLFSTILCYSSGENQFLKGAKLELRFWGILYYKYKKETMGETTVHDFFFPWLLQSPGLCSITKDNCPGGTSTSSEASKTRVGF